MEIIFPISLILIILFLKILEESGKFLILRRNIADGIVIVKKGKIKKVNPVLEEITGYKTKEIEGRSFLSLIDPKSRKKVKENSKKRLKGENPPDIYQVEIKTKKGEVIPVDLKSRKIIDWFYPALLVVVRNLRVQRGLEEVLHRQEKRFKAISENTPDIIARLDEEGRFVYVNKAAQKEFRMSSKEFFWKSIDELNLEGLEPLKENIKEVLKEGEIKSFYSERREEDNIKYFYSKIIPEFTKKGEIGSVILISRDVSELKEIDEVKTKFIALSTHQLRSPLSSMSWCLSSLEKEELGPLNSSQKKYLEEISQSTKTLIKITDAFLNVTMLDLGVFVINPKPTEITSLTNEIIDGFKKEIEEKKIKIIRDYPEKIFSKVDPRVINLTLKGLLSNAIKYSNKEGEVKIKWEKNEEDRLLLEVTDKGWGIPEKDKKYIFKKFFRAENVKGEEVFGTGLDLHIIKSLVEKAGGNIWFVSPAKNEEKGTSFYVNLPIKND